MARRRSDSPRRFRLREVVREATAAVVAMPWRSLVIAVVAAIGGLASCGVVSWEVDAIAQREVTRDLAGATVVEVTLRDRAPIPAGVCDNASQISGVRAAGGTFGEERVRPASLPGSDLTVRAVTPGMVAVLWPDTLWPHAEVPKGDPDRPGRSATSVVAGATAASVLGVPNTVGPGQDAVALAVTDANGADRALPITAAAPSSPRDPSVDNSLVVLDPPTGSLVSCLVDIGPTATGGVPAALAAWFAGYGKVSLTPAFATGATGGRQPAQEFAERFSRFVAPPAGMVVVLLSTAMWFGRRGDIALYRLLGMGRGRVALLVSTESVLTVAVPAAAGISAAVVLGLVAPGGLAGIFQAVGVSGPFALTSLAASPLGAQLHDLVVEATMTAAVQYVAILALIPLAALATVATTRPLDVLKER